MTPDLLTIYRCRDDATRQRLREELRARIARAKEARKREQAGDFSPACSIDWAPLAGCDFTIPVQQGSLYE